MIAPHLLYQIHLYLITMITLHQIVRIHRQCSHTGRSSFSQDVRMKQMCITNVNRTHNIFVPTLLTHGRLIQYRPQCCWLLIPLGYIETFQLGWLNYYITGPSSYSGADYAQGGVDHSRVRSGLTCTFRASCYSTPPSWTHTPATSWAVCLEQQVSTQQ